LTDPPYGISIVNNAKVGVSADVGFGTVGIKGMVNAKKYMEVKGDNEYFNAEYLTKIGKEQIIFGANHFCHSLPENSHWLVWDKKCEKGADHNNFSDVELVWCSHKKKSALIYRYLWSGLLREGERDVELKERVHPTQKPVGLLYAILKDYSEYNDIIYDPFGGSGSTMVATEQLNRKCYMMELDASYCQVIINRMIKLNPELEIKCLNRDFNPLDINGF